MWVRHLLLLIVAAALTRNANAEDLSNEAKAIEKIKLLGGQFTSSGEAPSRVVAVSFVGSTRISDQYLHLLKELKHLTSLNLRDVKITDAGLKELRDL